MQGQPLQRNPDSASRITQMRLLRLSRRFVMLAWALTFFVVAIIAAVLGFTSIAGAAAGIAKILFFIFLVLTLFALVAGAMRGRPPV